MKALIAMALVTLASSSFATDGIDLGSIKPKGATTTAGSASTTAPPAPAPIGASPLKKSVTDPSTIPGAPATTGIGAKIGSLNKGVFGSGPAKSDASSDAASDDLKVKMPSNFKK